MKTLVEMTDHIIANGRDYEYYTFYMTNGSKFTINEKEFYELDNLYNGELACKVEN